MSLPIVGMGFRVELGLDLDFSGVTIKARTVCVGLGSWLFAASLSHRMCPVIVTNMEESLLTIATRPVFNTGSC